jgi:mannobiose 2-epimerase
MTFVPFLFAMTQCQRPLDTMRHEIIDDVIASVLPFWANFSADPRGGFYGAIKFDGRPDPTADKSIVLNTRILYGFAAACRYWPQSVYFELADRAQRYLLDFFEDREYGGYYWSLFANGTVRDASKMTYGNTFIMYSFAEHYLATGNTTSLLKAIEQFELFQSKVFDKVNHGYVESFTRNWSVPAFYGWGEYPTTAKAANTHLHVLESLLNLYSAWPNPRVKAAIADLVNVFMTKIINHTRGHQHMNMALNWTDVDPLDSFGHDMEVSWLLSAAGGVIGNRTLIAEIERVVHKLVDTQLSEGLSGDALRYDVAPTHRNDNFQQWPQCESINALQHVYQVTKDERYGNQAIKMWNWVKSHMIDKVHGEWYKVVFPDGKADEFADKGDFWKGPYFNIRSACHCADFLKQSEGPIGPTATTATTSKRVSMTVFIVCVAVLGAAVLALVIALVLSHRRTPGPSPYPLLDSGDMRS